MECKSIVFGKCSQFFCLLLFIIAALTPLPSRAGVGSIPADDIPEAVEPLITSTWGQQAPYNYMCPLVDPTPWSGYLPGEDHCRVGCVAVAIGQIMRYHRWPLQGDGTASVTYPLTGSQTNEFSVDFSEAFYDYDNMLDDYSDGNYTDEQGRAVAQLLYHCAVASQMIFGSSASATTNFSTAEALGSHFRYDSSRIETKLRYLYTKKEWLDMIRSELAQGRPIFYEAVDINLSRGVYAHSFIIDGYNAEGLVHVNWGWNGQQNGYFDIDRLNVGNYKFNTYQDMTIGIEAPQQQPEGVADISATIPAAPVYTLQGRLVRPAATTLHGLPRGIYIWNGHKVVR